LSIRTCSWSYKDQEKKVQVPVIFIFHPFFMWDPISWMKHFRIRIRDKHPGSATLRYRYRYCRVMSCSLWRSIS
jgi:hypothetical protein